MSEKIGNAITDQKNVVELMTADTAIVSGDNSSLVCCVPIQDAISGTANSVRTRGVMAIIEKDEIFYQMVCVVAISPNESVDSITDGDVKNFIKKISLPTT